MRRLAVVLLMMAGLAGCWNPLKQYTEAKQKAEEAKKAAEQMQKAIASQVTAGQQQQGTGVKRAPGNTPEITGSNPREITGGQTEDVVFTVDAVDPNDVKMEAGGMCHIKAFKLVSPTQVQATVTADDAESGGCEIRLITRKRYVYYSMGVQLSPAAQARVQQKAQAEQEAAQKKMNDYIAHAKDAVGKRWDVKLPSGKTDTWTLVEQNQFGFSEFKNSKGEKLTIMVGEDDTSTVQYGQGCVLMGKLAGGKLTEGQSPIPGCALGTGAWSATISK